MENKLLSIGKTAKILGVSVDTLRQWEKKNILQAFRPSPSSKRYYRQEDIDRFLKNRPVSDKSFNDIVELAKNWVLAKEPTPISPDFYCQTNDVFSARLQRLERELAGFPELKDTFQLIIAIAGEIGNNSYNHNIGNWPDVPGIFMGFDRERRVIVLADRGRGVFESLQCVLPDLKNDEDALMAAFTKYVSGRAPENRGNGLKFVKDAVQSHHLDLQFFSGAAKLGLKQGVSSLAVTTTTLTFHGCLAIIHF